MEKQAYYLSENLTLLLILVISFLFTLIGILHSKKYQNLSNYLTAGRNVNSLSLTTSLVASALGAWVLFGPASASTWGGIGSVIGYSLGTAFPMLAFIFLGTKIRKVFYSKSRRRFQLNNFHTIYFFLVSNNPKGKRAFLIFLFQIH